jgi:hypothetical protein
MDMQADDEYEYQERAAIRQLDAGYGEIEADQLALIDLKERADRQRQEQERKDAEERKKQLASEQREAAGSRDEIGLLRSKASKVRLQMERTSEPAEKQRLFRQWNNLQSEIIAIRKGRAR